MDPRYRYYNSMQQPLPFYYHPYPVFAPPFGYDHVNPGRSRHNPSSLHHHPWVIPPHMHQYSSYLHQHQYLAYPTTSENPSFDSSDVSRAFEEFLDETLILLNDLEADSDSSQQDGASSSGLSKEKISEQLHVYTRQEKNAEDEDVDTCPICLDEFGENQKVGMLQCRHKFHSECITSWLLSKNSCPMCRSTALKV